MIAVVTPFCEDGVMSWLQVTLAVIMGVDVDKAGRDQFCPWRRSLSLPLAVTLPTSVMRPPDMATSAS